MALAVLTILFGAAILWAARHLSTTIRERSAWSSVPGTLLERDAGGAGRGACSLYEPRVRYTYAVAEQEYSNDQFYLVGRTYSRRRRPIQALLDRLEPRVMVHYDPADPSRSYLVKNPRWHTWLPYVFGSSALILGIMELVVALAGR